MQFTKPAFVKAILLLTLYSPTIMARNLDFRRNCIDCDISERQRCECREHLAAAKKEALYICDPDHEDRFLVCHAPDRAVSLPCDSGAKWNAFDGACGPVRKCDAWLCADPNCGTKTTPAPTTTTAPPTTTLATTTAPPTTTPATTTAPPTTTLAATTAPPTTTRATTAPPTTTLPTTTTSEPIPVTTSPPQVCDVYFEFHPEKMNWYTAKRVCEANQGSLATVPSLDIQHYLRERFGSTSKAMQIWVGASDRKREGLWEWVTGERFGFTNWYRNKPSSKKYKDCLLFNYYEMGAWSDADCDLNKPFVCQHIVCAK